MQLLIDRDSGNVTINGRTHQIDMTSVQPEIAQVKWNDDHGSISYRDGRDPHGIGDIFRFKEIIDLWNEKQIAMRTR